VKYTELRR